MTKSTLTKIGIAAAILLTPTLAWAASQATSGCCSWCPFC